MFPKFKNHFAYLLPGSVENVYLLQSYYFYFFPFAPTYFLELQPLFSENIVKNWG